jgi:hypothetical protein
MKERDDLEKIVAQENIILELIFKRKGGKEWIHFALDNVPW